MPAFGDGFHDLHIADYGGSFRTLDYVEYPDEDHGLRRYEETVRDRLERMERFFEKHLKLGAPSSLALRPLRPSARREASPAAGR